MVIVLFASEVPDKASWVILMSASLSMTGAGGASVSTMTDRVFDTELVLLPNESVAVKPLAPSAKVPVKKVQAPFAFAVVVPRSVAPSKTLTVLSATAVPSSVRTLASMIPSPRMLLSGENETIWDFLYYRTKHASVHPHA